jgi:hypothetical protein
VKDSERSLGETGWHGTHGATRHLKGHDGNFPVQLVVHDLKSMALMYDIIV